MVLWQKSDDNIKSTHLHQISKDEQGTAGHWLDAYNNYRHPYTQLYGLSQ